MRSRTTLLAVIVAVLLLPVPASATVGTPSETAPPGIGIRLLDVPSDRSDDPRANNYIVDHAIPGASVQRRLMITNGTDHELPVQVSGATARIDDADGWVVQGEGESPPGSMADWITVEPATFTLAPRSGFEVTAVIAVPAGTPPGERYGAIIAQPPGVASGAVDLVSRVGLRVYLSVGGNEPETDFEIDTLTASRTEQGEPSVDVGILNTGGRAIDVSGELELEDESGSVTAGPFPTALPQTLAPQSRGQVSVPLPESLAAGPWKVTATMRSGLVERVAETTITFPDEPGTTADPAESDTIGGTDAEGNDISERLRNQRRALLPLAVILILLALGALWLIVMWKRREEDEGDENASPGAAEVSAGVGEDG